MFQLVFDRFVIFFLFFYRLLSNFDFMSLCWKSFAIFIDVCQNFRNIQDFLCSSTSFYVQFS